MEFQTAKQNAKIQSNRKLCLEDYLHFIQSHKQFNLTVSLLNQIISMHGFNKIQPAQKKILIDAVNSIDLIDPTRSTLNDKNVSSFALMTLEEVIKDLNDLNWQECCVTSIQTLNLVNYDSVLQNADAVSSKSKSKRSRKRRKSATLGGVGSGGSGTATAGGCCGGFEGSQSGQLVAVRSNSDVSAGDFGAVVGEYSQLSSASQSIAPF